MSYETKEGFLKPLEEDTVNHHEMLQKVLVVPSQLCLKSGRCTNKTSGQKLESMSVIKL